jgi:L-rhamnose-H+ transport protein
MGKYGFSSWTLHMASIIVFSSLWGFALKEWKGAKAKTITFVLLGIAILLASTVIIGLGNAMKD